LIRNFLEDNGFEIKNGDGLKYKATCREDIISVDSYSIAFFYDERFFRLHFGDITIEEFYNFTQVFSKRFL